MLRKNVSTSNAKIELQKRFCESCSLCIKNKLSTIEDINGLELFPDKSLVNFNFTKANILSRVLNILSSVGFPEKGECKSKNKSSNSICKC